MERLIEISAILAGVAVFVLIAVLSWMSDGPKHRSAGEGDHFLPGNYHSNGDHIDHG